jgi:hypothetical protein
MNIEPNFNPDIYRNNYEDLKNMDDEQVKHHWETIGKQENRTYSNYNIVNEYNFTNNLDIYKQWSDYCKCIVQTNSLYNFKNHPDILYMTEHSNLYTFANDWITYITFIMNKYNIQNEFIEKTIKLNEIYGNSVKDCTFLNIKCSANTIKYIYMAMLLLDNLLLKNINNIDFVEIGGGYGGFAVITYTVLKHMNIKLNKYILIDLSDVIDLQKLYITNIINDNIFEFVNFNDIDNIKINNGFVFSSYCLSEMPVECRQKYYNTVFNNIKNGIFFWNTLVIDINKDIYKLEMYEEYPRTGPNNNIIYIEKK